MNGLFLTTSWFYLISRTQYFQLHSAYWTLANTIIYHVKIRQWTGSGPEYWTSVERLEPQEVCEHKSKYSNALIIIATSHWTRNVTYRKILEIIETVGTDGRKLKWPPIRGSINLLMVVKCMNCIEHVRFFTYSSLL